MTPRMVEAVGNLTLQAAKQFDKTVYLFMHKETIEFKTDPADCELEDSALVCGYNKKANVVDIYEDIKAFQRKLRDLPPERSLKDLPAIQRKEIILHSKALPILEGAFKKFITLNTTQVAAMLAKEWPNSTFPLNRVRRTLVRMEREGYIQRDGFEQVGSNQAHVWRVK